MLAQPLDLLPQLDKAPLQYRRRVSMGAIENRANVAELETRIAIQTHLAQTVEVPLAVEPVVAGAPAHGLQQPHRFVVQHRAAAEAARPRQTCHCQRHRSCSSLNPAVLDRSRSL